MQSFVDGNATMLVIFFSILSNTVASISLITMSQINVLNTHTRARGNLNVVVEIN